MTIRIMLKKCIHCHKKYLYNPSVGNFGWICPYCKKLQTNTGNDGKGEFLDVT